MGRRTRTGWNKTVVAPKGSKGDQWTYVFGGAVHHCGHPTANYPWAAYDANGKLILAPNGRAFCYLREAQEAVEHAELANGPRGGWIEQKRNGNIWHPAGCECNKCEKRP